MMSYLCLLDREMSCVGLPPTIAIITWFMISIGNLSSFDGSNVEESNFKEELKWHSNKDEVYFIFSGAEDWGRIIIMHIDIMHCFTSTRRPRQLNCTILNMMYFQIICTKK